MNKSKLRYKKTEYIMFLVENLSASFLIENLDFIRELTPQCCRLVDICVRVNAFIYHECHFGKHSPKLTASYRDIRTSRNRNYELLFILCLQCVECYNVRSAI